MSKKQKRRTVRSSSKFTQLTPEATERKALEDLEAGHFRDAIAGFKQLLKLESRPAWCTALADAYAGRARELAAKGMLKEALVMWENRSGLGGDIALDPDHAALLLRMGRVEPVCDLLGRGNAVPLVHDPLRALLAARLLAGDATVAKRLAPLDPVMRYAEAARSALAAYCAGDAPALRAALAAIPFRSPYRDWVQILKALQCLPDKPQEAAALLRRLGEGSAFGRLKEAAELVLLPETAFLEAIRGSGRNQARFACMLRGWPPERIRLWEELGRLGAEPRPLELLRFLYRHGAALGSDWVRRRGLRLLVDEFPASLKWFDSLRAVRLTREERLLITAWLAERSGDLWEVQDAWEAHAQHLIERADAPDQEPTSKLRIALALRRCNVRGNVLSRHKPSSDPEDLDRVVAEQVEESLKWDPDELESYLDLIHYYRRGQRFKDVRRLLDRATERWPQDLQLLGAAMDTALDGGAFKKAAGLARQILTLDPINSGVRERLVEAHLAHARKQILKGRLDLAHKELAAAEQWVRGGHPREQLDLISAFLGLIEEADSGAAALREVAKRLGDGFSAQVALALAGNRVGLLPQDLLKAAELQTARIQGRDDLLAALNRLRAHLDQGGKLSREIDTFLNRSFKRAPWPKLSRTELEAACDTLRRCRLHQVRLSVARLALKQWRGAPVFELHAFEARYPKGFDGRSNDAIRRLELALERARDEGDTRTALRIKETLVDLNPFAFGPSPFMFPPDDDEEDDELLDASSLDDSVAADFIITLIETLGLRKALDIIGITPDMKRELKGMIKEFGEDHVKRLVIELFRRAGDGDSRGGRFPRPPDLF